MEEMKGTLAGLILHEKPAKVLLSLKGSKGKYASIIAKETDCTYTHILKILAELEDNDIVVFKKEGRTKVVELTEKGEDIAHELEGLVRRLGRASGKEKPEETPEEESEE